MPDRSSIKQLHIILIAALAAFALGGAARPARASGGGLFQVNSLADNNIPDSKITLREAIMMANGGTGPNGLDRELSDEEWYLAIQAGCSLTSGPNLIVDYCGAGFADTIIFSNALPSYGTIVLKSPLPGLVDTQPTTIDGANAGMYPTIDATPLHAGYSYADGLVVGSPGSVIKSIGVTGSPRWAFNIYGPNIQLQGVWAWKSGDAGISLRGSGDLVDGARVGVAAASDTSCAAGLGNSYEGIALSAGATNSQVKNSVIGCNGTAGAFSGVSLIGAGTSYNTLGPNNHIGTNAANTADLGNAHSNGVRVAAGAHRNTLIGNTIMFNDLNGIYIGDANLTSVGGNTIRKNGIDGVYITGTAQNSNIGGPSFLNTMTGNLISANLHDGVAIVGAAAFHNLLAGNMIGATADGKAADGNTRDGVRLEGASENYIGNATAAANVIGGNHMTGVRLLNGAQHNSIAHNYIGAQLGGNAALPNGWNGLWLDGDAHDNTIGGNQSAGNVIGYNNVIGVFIQGAGANNNSLLGNQIVYNGGDGVFINAGATGNLLGGAQQNTIDSNGLQGVEIGGGAHGNQIIGNTISHSGKNGIMFNGAGTSDNLVSGVTLHQNSLDGINERGGASGNAWSQLALIGNGYKGGGLPIDKYGDSDASNQPDWPNMQFTSVAASGQTTTIKGTADPSGLAVVNTIEIYAIKTGQIGSDQTFYVGSAPVDNAGHWTAGIPNIGGCLAALVTTKNLWTGTSASTELGLGNCKSQTISFAALTGKTLGDAPFVVSASASSGLPVSFSSGAPAVCTVSGKTVTLVGAGSCTIVASQSGDDIYQPAQDVEQTFAVDNPAKQSQTISFAALPDKALGDAPFAVSASASSGLPVSFSSTKPAVCTVSGNIVTLTAAGKCTIVASQGGNGSYNPAADVKRSFVVTNPAKQNQTITFAAPGNKVLGDTPFAISANASSGLPVSFSSSTPGICTVSGNIVTLVSAGTCTIIASQDGDGSYNPAADMARSFTVSALAPNPGVVLYLPLVAR